VRVSLAAIVANPASGKDIRRLVAHGSVFDNQEKVRMVRRLLLGLERAGVERVLYMPEGYGIVPRALNAIRPDMAVDALEMPVRNNQDDSVRAAEIMETLGADVVIVLGGDGTSRAVCKGLTRVPVLPLSTGTNNVFPFMLEASVAGLAAGLVATGAVDLETACVRSTKLDILVDGEPVDIALVDAAVYEDVFVASRAVWDMSKVSKLCLTRCRPDSIGLSAIGGQLETIRPEEPRGLVMDLGANGEKVVAAIAPGLFEEVGIVRRGTMEPGCLHPVGHSPCLIALDGEREVSVRRGSEAAIRLSMDGPLVVDVSRVMEAARRRGLFVR
jgi:predicted polyphosphate/ATP-dependent NAD kinase